MVPDASGTLRSWSSSWVRCPQSTDSARPERTLVTDVLAFLQNLQTVAFVMLGVAVAVGWARHRGRAQGYLGLAIILLSLVSVLGRLPQLLHVTVPGLSDLDLILFVGSAYALLRFRDSLIPLPRAWHVAAVSAIVVGLVLFFGAQLIGAPVQVQTVAALLIIAVWGVSVLEPIRSEEHTSELQSQVQLVCRPPLEQ